MTLLLQIVSRNSEIALQWTFNGETLHGNQRQLVFNEYWWNNGIQIVWCFFDIQMRFYNSKFQSEW